jgi:hypothetical protein
MAATCPICRTAHFRLGRARPTAALRRAPARLARALSRVPPRLVARRPARGNHLEQIRAAGRRLGERGARRRP